MTRYTAPRQVTRVLRGALATRTSRNLAADIVGSVGTGLVQGVLNVLLPSVARRAGLDPVGLALLLASPFLANVLGIVSGRMDLTGTRAMATIRSLGFALLLLLVLLPPPAWALLTLLCWAGVSFTQPAQLRLWGAMYPPRERGRLVGTAKTGQAGALAFMSLVGGAAADRIGGPLVVAAAGLSGALCVQAYRFVRLPPPNPAIEPRLPPRYTPIEAWGALGRNPRIQKLAWAQALWGAGMIAAAPLYPLVQVDRLQLSLAEIGSLGIISAAATMLTYVAWGHLTDRVGALPVLMAGAALGLVVPGTYALAGSFAVLWIAALCQGLSAAAMDSGITAALSHGVPLDERPSLLAGWNALTGARGVVVPLIAGFVVQAGLLEPGAALLVSAAICLTGVALYVLIAVRERGARPRTRASARAAR